MQVVHHPTELKNLKPRVCAAIGVFDGVHLGHQEVIRRTVEDARKCDAASVVITFDRHPSTIVAPDRVPAMISTQAQRVRGLAAGGVEAIWMIPFDRQFSQKTGEVFVGELRRQFPGLASLSVGSDFVFGHRRSGNLALLRQMGEEHGFTVNGLAPVLLDGEVVSSTRIRQLIASARFDLAQRMLGRPWSLAGEVQQGEQLGRKLGFPTANLPTSGLILPPNGVYAVAVAIGGEKLRRPGVLNLGVRPTFAQAQPVVRAEVHLLDFDGDLYGQELEVWFLEKLREEQKFDSVDALKRQISHDLAAARAFPPSLLNS